MLTTVIALPWELFAHLSPIVLPNGPSFMSLSSNNLKSVANGFDHFFAGNIDNARKVFADNPSDPYHLLGLAVCSFLEAAMSMEVADVANAADSLAESLQLSSKYLKTSKSQSATRFPPGMEWEVLIADATILSGLVNVFSETYIGYGRCVIALANARSRFTKLFNTVFPNGLDDGTLTTVGGGPSNQNNSFFGLLSGAIGRGGHIEPFEPKGALEELIVSGTAFGFGLFNLVLSMLPRAARRIVNWFITSDQRGALRALRVAATYKNDAHSVFARLVLMLYMSLLLQMTPWQTDTEQMREEFQSLLDPIIDRYPSSNLWALYQAKLMRVTNNQDNAIATLEEGTKPGRPFVFKQADMMVVYELGWTLVGERRYEEAAKAFIKMKELNQWHESRNVSFPGRRKVLIFASRERFTTVTPGCYIAIGKLDEGQKLLDDIPNLVSKKIAGKSQPTEIFLKKKIEFYKGKRERSGRAGAKYVEFVKIGLAEELGIFWNNHAYVSQAAAQEHIDVLLKLTPTIPVQASPDAEHTGIADETHVDLDTPDELAIRSLLLGILYRTLGDCMKSRRHLSDAYALREKVLVSTWVGGLSLFETAALDLIEMDVMQRDKLVNGRTTENGESVRNRTWERVLREANRKLDEALEISSQSVDLSSRLDSRICMLKEEIKRKCEMVGVTIDC